MVPWMEIARFKRCRANIPLLRVMPLWPVAGSTTAMSLIVPFSCMPAGSFNVTNICRPMNWAAMMNYGSVPG